MKVKTYVFDDVKKGIEILKKEYGPDTVILDIKENTKSTDGIKNYEISVAISDDLEEKNGSACGVLKKRDGVWEGLLDGAVEKISLLISEIVAERLKVYPLALRSFYEKMVKNGFDAKLAMDIISETYSQIGDLSAQTSKVSYFIKETLFKKIKMADITDISSHIILLGPPGVGKTQTAKKLGMMLGAIGKPVSVILYRYKSENKEAYERGALNIISVDKKETLLQILNKDSTKKIVDVPGRVDLQREIMENVNDAKKIIVFSAGSRDEKIKRYLDIYGYEDTFGTIFTKLDEEDTLGHILSNLILFDQKVCCFTTGKATSDIVMPGKDLFYKILFEGNKWIQEEVR